MNVAFMHLAVQQGVDKINSLQADMLLPQEIDIELNKSMFKFVNLKYGKNNKFNTGFEESQKRIDDLRSLLREVLIPTTYKEQLLSNIWVDTVAFPADYMYYINSRSTIALNDCNPISFDIEATADVSYFNFDLNFLTTDNTAFIDSIFMRTDPADVTTANYLNIPIFQLPSQFVFPQDIEELRLWIIDPDNWPVGFQIYWENFGSISHTGEFIVVVDTMLYPQYNHDGSVTNAYTSTNLITSIVALDSTNNIVTVGGGVELINYANLAALNNTGTRVTTAATKRIKTENKFSQLDDIFTMLEDPFNTTKHTSPLFTVRRNNMDLYTSDIFIIEEVKLTYLKLPTDISLSLGINCELPDHTHREIVDMTISSILEGISDPRYKTHEAESGKNE